MNYYEHHLGDYVKDAGHLTMVEDGAYRRLIDAYYIKEAPIPLDMNKACRLARAMDPDERTAVETVLNEFFDKTEHGWTHGRCDEEIARYREKQAAEPAKKENDRQRQQRARDRRKQMFEFLRDHGVTAPWDATTEQLQAAIDNVKKAGQGADIPPPSAPDHTSDHAPVTEPVTPPVTRDNTATQSPVPSHHYSGADAPARPAAEPAEPPAPAPELPARLPCGDLIPENPDLYGTPGNQTAEQRERELWHAGKAILLADGVSKAVAGSFVGGLVQKFGRDIVVEVVRAAVVERPAGPKAWMQAACQTRAGIRRNVTPIQSAAERRGDHLADLIGDDKPSENTHANHSRTASGDVIDVAGRFVDPDVRTGT